MRAAGSGEDHVGGEKNGDIPLRREACLFMTDERASGIAQETCIKRQDASAPFLPIALSLAVLGRFFTTVTVMVGAKLFHYRAQLH